MQQAQTEDNEANLDEDPNGHYMDCKKIVHWEMTLVVVHSLGPVDIR